MRRNVLKLGRSLIPSKKPFKIALIVAVLTGIFCAAGVADKVYYMQVFWIKMAVLAAGLTPEGPVLVTRSRAFVISKTHSFVLVRQYNEERIRRRCADLFASVRIQVLRFYSGFFDGDLDSSL